DAIAHRTFRFADPADKWMHDLLAGLVESLDAFVADDPHTGTMRSVKDRLDSVRSMRKRSVDGHEDEGNDAVASIGDPSKCPKYESLKIVPQVGLVPVGRDSDSGLWEFAVISSGGIPARGEDGKLIIREESAIVLVLIPGGTFRMGSPRSEIG